MSRFFAKITALAAETAMLATAQSVLAYTAALRVYREPVYAEEIAESWIKNKGGQND